VTAGRFLYPETGYATLGGDRVAYQTVGVGPPDLVLTWGSFSNADVDWTSRMLPASTAGWHRSVA
jgi:hypothetical protein